jgi:hypothetical protein
MPTSANPYIKPAEIEAMRADMSEQAFAQEVLAQFISWSGSVFSGIREAVTDSPQGKAAVIGVDWAGASGGGDYTAFAVVSYEGHVLELVRMRGEPYVARARLEGLWQRHGRPPILAEENGMGAVQNAEFAPARRERAGLDHDEREQDGDYQPAGAGVRAGEYSHSEG